MYVLYHQYYTVLVVWVWVTSIRTLLKRISEREGTAMSRVSRYFLAIDSDSHGPPSFKGIRLRKTKTILMEATPQPVTYLLAANCCL